LHFKRYKHYTFYFDSLVNYLKSIWIEKKALFLMTFIYCLYYSRWSINNIKLNCYFITCSYRKLYQKYRIFMKNFFPITTGQMFMMNRFFDGAFLTFGIDVIRFLESDQEDRVDPMIFIFPRMTKCIFHKFGVSGEVETHDSICILPLNAVNEKIYVFLWFWFMILGVLSAAVIVYR